MDTIVCIGPPGTGKTHSGTGWIHWGSATYGIPPEAIAFSSFTNAACNEARGRLAARMGWYDYELPHCATLHAECKRALRIEGKDWLADGKWLEEFGREKGYAIKVISSKAREDMDELVKTGGEDALLLEIWNFGRARLITDPEASWETFKEYDPDATDKAEFGRYMAFVSEYEAAKTIGFRRDMPDLLLDLLKHPVTLPVDLAVVDESQDLSPALAAVADVLYGDAHLRATIGDADQAIFSYQGASPELLNSRMAEKTVQLRQSRRLPRKIMEHAGRVISENRNRRPVIILPVTAEIVQARPGRGGPVTELELEGEVRRVWNWGEAELNNGDTWGLLIRNWAFAGLVASQLESQGFPYRVNGEGYYTPWSDRGPYKAARAVLTLGTPGGKVSAAELVALLDKTHASRGEKQGAWVYGTKGAAMNIAAENAAGAFSLRDLPELGLTEWGLRMIAKRDLRILSGNISDRDLEAYRAANNAGRFWQQPKHTLSTIHGAKGQEWGSVLVLDACTYAPSRNLDSDVRRSEEIRLAYVAITRAKHRFLVLQTDAGNPYDVFGI